MRFVERIIIGGSCPVALVLGGDCSRGQLS